MRNKLIWIAGIIIIVILIFLANNFFNLKYGTLTSEDLVINSEVSGDISSELDAELIVKSDAEDIIYITLRGKSRAIHSNNFTENLTIFLPDGISLISGDSEDVIEVIGNEVAEINVKVRISDDDEKSIIACVSSDNYYGYNDSRTAECEGFYVLSKRGKILISKKSAT